MIAGIISLLFVMLLLAIPGCQTEQFLQRGEKKLRHSAIIVVPGYYGTRLVRQSDHTLIWVSASEALFGNQPLTLPVPGLKLHNTIELRPETILDSVQVIPALYSVDVYGSLLDKLRDSHEGLTQVIPFTYDWRNDLMEAVDLLDGTIQRLRLEGTNDISIVAHSLGGLIVSYYLRYGAQTIESAEENWAGAEAVSTVVMAGVPFLGVMNSFRNMNFGESVYFNDALLTSEAYSSFPSSYYTLPVFETDQLLTPNQEPLKGNIRNPENWKNFGWGLLTNQAALSSEIVLQRTEYMAHWLDRSRLFLGLLHAPLERSEPIHLPLLYLFGKGTPTLDNGVWMKKETGECNCLFFDNPDRSRITPSIDTNLLYEDGDETVTVRSAMLPSAYRKALNSSVKGNDAGHTALVTDAHIQQVILSFLEAH